LQDTLDPPDWKELRTLGHRMLDDMFDYLASLRDRPVWQPIPEDVRQTIREPVPVDEGNLSDIYQDFLKNILPYSVGNTHPGFMGWVHGGGTPVGMLAEMLAAGLNANLGGRNQMPVEVERQIASWMRELFDFPASAGGLFVTGTSIANFLAVLAARTSFSGPEIRKQGVGFASRRLTAYTSVMAHKCIAQAMDMAGIGSDCLRMIETDESYRMRTNALREAIAGDIQSGHAPFLIIATAGTVDVGSIDDIAAIADIAAANHLWLHVDGAYGALARMSPELSPKLSGIERANSIAFDFHKWGQVPYDAGFILVRNIEVLQNTFGSPAAYLQREPRGLAASSPWPCDLGPDLSRGFRALKTWFTIKAYGTRRLGAMIEHTCAVASYLKKRVEEIPELELLAPVVLNIVCFRYRCRNADAINGEIVVEIQESGIAAPSTTIIGGRLAIRAAIVNHRTQYRDIDSLIDAVLSNGRKLSNSHSQSF
jgi:aromatic-L-amino-acid/L-tryptophan decarboxylase